MDKSVYDILRYDILENNNLYIRIKQLEVSNIMDDSRKKFELEQCKELFDTQLKMKNEFSISLFVEFEQISKEYAILKEFSDCLDLPGSKVSIKVHSNLVNKQNDLQKICQKAQNILNKYSNFSLIHNGEIKSLNKIFEAYGKSFYDVSNMYVDYCERLNKENLGVNIDFYNKIQSNKHSFLDYTNPNFKLKELDAPAFNKLEPIYNDIKKKIGTINALKEQGRLPIHKDNYDSIMRNYGEIIYKYQTIQNILLVKLAFQNTSATKYYDILNKEIDKLSNEIMKKAINANKLSNKLGIDYHLNRNSFENQELEKEQVKVQNENELNDDTDYNKEDNYKFESKENNEEFVKQDSSTNNIKDNIEKLKSMSSSLSRLESDYYQKYSIYKMKTGDNISFIDYLKLVKDYNSKEVLTYYELKSKVMLEIYNEYSNEFYDKYKNEYPNEPWLSETVFINFCNNNSKIIKSLGGIDSIIGEADLIDFYNNLEAILIDNEKKLNSI